MLAIGEMDALRKLARSRSNTVDLTRSMAPPLYMVLYATVRRVWVVSIVLYSSDAVALCCSVAL